MAIVMMMKWPEVTPEKYDAVRAIARFDVDPPEGGAFHVAAFGEDGLHVVDVWSSAEEFQAFVEARLNPAVAQVGLTTEPEITILPVHYSFAPALMFTK